VLSTAYAEQKGQIGALSAHNLVKNLVKFWSEKSIRPLHGCSSLNRFWKPGRGQNTRLFPTRPLECVATSAATWQRSCFNLAVK